MLFPFNIYSFLNNPRHYLLELQKNYGDPFPLSFPGTPTVWLSANPELIKTIFTAAADSFMASENNPVAPLLGPGGLITLSGSEHLQKRKEFIPYFSKKHVQSKALVIQDVFFQELDCLAQNGQLNLQHFSLGHTLQIIIKYLFPHLSLTELKEAQTLTEAFLKSYSASYLFIPKWVPGTWGKFDQKKLQLDDRFYDFFLSGIKVEMESPLSVLSAASKTEVLDHIRTFIVAGHETSATSLIWALYYIHQFPHVKNRLAEELEIFGQKSKELYLEDLLKNTYLDALISEVLRIEPPVPFVTRKIINRNFQLGDRELEIDQELGVCISLLHRHSKTWSNPAEFRPERFLAQKYTPYEYAPFGGGTRKCIGAELAVLELKILIGLFIKYYDSSLLPASPPAAEVLQITVGPKKAILLNYSKKSI